MNKIHIHNVNIDTHMFKIDVPFLYNIKDLLIYIEDNIDDGIITTYSNKEKVIDKLDTPLEKLDISRLPSDNYVPPILTEILLTNNNFKVVYNNTLAFKYNVYRDRGIYYIKFNMFGLTQYSKNDELCKVSLYRHNIYKRILSYIDTHMFTIYHTRLDICIDILHIDFMCYDIIQSNGAYRKWNYVEVRNKNRYSRDRGIKDGVFITDRALYTNQVIVNVYDKGYKNMLGVSMVRVPSTLHVSV